MESITLKECFITCKSTRISHKSPENPNGHRQMAELSLVRHLPPCWQGTWLQRSAVHSSEKKKNINKSFLINYWLFDSSLFYEINTYLSKEGTCLFFIKRRDSRLKKNSWMSMISRSGFSNKRNTVLRDGIFMNYF